MHTKFYDVHPPPPTPRKTIPTLLVFDNTLDFSANGQFSVVLEGVSDVRAGLPTDTPRVETPAVSQTQPNTDGTYDVSWLPRFAGKYTMSINYTDSGGLLGTYYRQKDLKVYLVFSLFCLT